MEQTLPELALVEQSARGFVNRFRATIEAQDCVSERTMAPEVLAGCCDQGWLDALSDPELVGSQNGPIAARGYSESAILATLVHELAKVSPSLGTRLLCHHFARWWILAAAPNQEGADALHPFDWLSIAAFQRDGGMFDCPSIPETQGIQSLPRQVPLVIGGSENNRLVCSVIDSDSQLTLLLVTLDETVKRSAVRSLGLMDAGLANIDFSGGSIAKSVVISNDLTTIQRTRISALRSVLPAYAAICRAIFLNCYAIAKTHAESRYQGGGFIVSLPQIREKLRTIKRSIAFAKLVEHATPEDYDDPEELFVPLRKALLQSTDAAIQVLGGAGYVTDGGLTTHWRDARQLAALFGSNLGALT